MLYLAKLEADHPFRVQSRAGSRLPAWTSGLGKVLLAALPPDEVRARLSNVEFTPFTKTTVRSLEELEGVLESVRAEGIGRDHGDLRPGICCLAAPVLDRRGRVMAAMSCTMQTEPDRQTEQTIIDALNRHARDMSQSLGWRPVSPR